VAPGAADRGDPHGAGSGPGRVLHLVGAMSRRTDKFMDWLMVVATITFFVIVLFGRQINSWFYQFLNH
jgi:preprotein translocase subunit SecG